MLQSNGQLCWQSLGREDGTKILHLRRSSNEPWRVYTAMPEYAVPDYRIPKGSKGWATYQKLRSLGWELLSEETSAEFLVSS